MWIFYIILAAFFNALWTALSKRELGFISPYRFTVVFRSLTALFLLPLFLYDFKISTSPIFWAAILCAGILEMIGIHSQAIGVKKDFYSTYGISNISPLLTLIIAPVILPENINLILILGVIFTVLGAFIFYQINPKFSVFGLIRALTMVLSTILAKIAIGYSSGLTYPFISFAIGVWIMVIASPFVKEHIDWSFLGRHISRIIPLAFFSAIATSLYYISLQSAPIIRVNTLVRTNIIFGFIFSYFILKEQSHIKRKIFASIFVFIGTILIVLSYY